MKDQTNEIEQQNKNLNTTIQQVLGLLKVPFGIHNTTQHNTNTTQHNSRIISLTGCSLKK